MLRAKALGEYFSHRFPYKANYRLRQPDGTYIQVYDQGQAEFSDQGRPLRLQGSLQTLERKDVSNLEQARKAIFDKLTGLYNHNRLNEALQLAIAQHQRYGGTGAYLVVDIDHLNLVNTTYGYEVGDALLIAVSQRLEQYMSERGILGRVNADRFGIIVSQADEAKMAALAEEIMKLFRESPVQTAKGTFQVTVSIGGILFPSEAQTSFDVMSKAESSVDCAKGKGRDRFIAYYASPEQKAEQRHNLEIGDQVRSALTSHKLIFAYQSIIDIKSNQVACYECLLRLKNPDGTITLPGVFIPVVERLGLARLVDRYVLGMVIQDLIEYPNVNLAINISRYTALDKSWFDYLSEQIKSHPEIASRLIIELIETTAIQDVDEMKHFVKAVRQLGVRIAIDDFGAAFTSFHHLRIMPVDLVKIDGSYIRDIANNQENRMFVRSLTGMRNNLGLKIVAEWVENQADADYLKQEGVDFLQGYHFGKPSIDRPWIQ